MMIRFRMLRVRRGRWWLGRVPKRWRVQETLTNIARHAQAKSASILIEKCGDFVRAIVEDDGIGFDVNTDHGERHLGRLGMRERSELLGGTLAYMRFCAARCTSTPR